MTIASGLHLDCQLSYCRNRSKKGTLIMEYTILNLKLYQFIWNTALRNTGMILTYCFALRKCLCFIVSYHHQHTQQTVPIITDGCQ